MSRKANELQNVVLVIALALLADLVLSSATVAASPSLGYAKGRPYYGSERASRSSACTVVCARDL